MFSQQCAYKFESLSSKYEEYKEGSNKIWDISGDAWESFDGVGTLEVASMSLDEPNLEGPLLIDDDEGREDIVIIPISWIWYFSEI